MSQGDTQMLGTTASDGQGLIEDGGRRTTDIEVVQGPSASPQGAPGSTVPVWLSGDRSTIFPRPVAQTVPQLGADLQDKVRDTV